jgi:hypothetical protein
MTTEWYLFLNSSDSQMSAIMPVYAISSFLGDSQEWVCDISIQVDGVRERVRLVARHI